MFTKCSALDLAPKRIRVNSINPGLIRTSIFENSGTINDSNKDAFFDYYARDYLVGRIGEVSDTSSAIAFLISNPFINGIHLPVDGGLMCSGSSECLIFVLITSLKRIFFPFLGALTLNAGAD